ncbi:MAG: YHS domain-containing protein [Deltaproteobacteria bacterium]|nr:YHS domain-containing protein [Deltaproteobacteria bacterium]
MKKHTGIIFAAAFSLSLSIGTAWAKPQENCPVMGGKINKSVYTDYNGKRIYFCCNACPEPFKKDPESYIKKMESAGVEFEKAPVAKPVPVPVPAQKAE